MHGYTKEEHLIIWSSSHGSKGVLPDLIRRLVMHFIQNDDFIEPPDFPANCVVNRSGFDGILKTRSSNFFSSTSISVWELSTSKGIEGKANYDIKTRISSEAEIDSNKISYIALTSNRWDGKKAWKELQINKKIWADVRSYDCTDIALWLSNCRDVEAWFFEKVLHLPPPVYPKTVELNTNVDDKPLNYTINIDLSEHEDTYLENIKHIDLILKSNKPTKAQIIFVFGLIESAKSYYNHFFENVRTSFWFNILNSKGYFVHDNNPEPIKAENGYQMPFWPMLQYLEKLSQQISKNQNMELIEKLLKIIQDVTSHPKDNLYTWHSFIKILINIPNDKIPLFNFENIKIWLDSNFKTDLQSSIICKGLLQKFLNTNSSIEDSQKAEKILHFLFSIKKKNKEDTFDAFSDSGKSYSSYITLYWLKAALIDNNLVSLVAQYCSIDLIYQLCDSLKLILLDYPSGKKHEITCNETKYLVRIKYINNDIELVLESRENNQISSSTINNFEEISENELADKIYNFLKGSKLLDPSEKDINSIIDTLFDDFSYISIYTLQFFKQEYRDGDSIFKTFSLILMELLDLKIKIDPKAIINILNDLIFGRNYCLPFFKRIALHTISNNWNSNSKQIFWQMIKNNDAYGYFSKPHYSKEIYYLLQNNISKFNKDECNIINKIIANGPKIELEKDQERYNAYWKFELFSALRENPEYKEQYELLSKQFGTSYQEFERTGFVFTRVGTVSPFTNEQILKMDSQEIVQHIMSFKQKFGIDEPSIEGFADLLNKTVKENPLKFSNQINAFIGIPYFYIYRILNGFREAWKSKKEFNCNNVFEFCLAYIKDPRFSKGDLEIEDDNWNANYNWVIGAIADLISEGTRNDEHAFNIQLLAILKEILFILSKYIEPSTDNKENYMDLPTYTLNSTPGKLLHALFDFTWRNAIKNYQKDDKIKWEADVKQVFEQIQKKKIIDIYIIQGWYFKQFYYLDKKWTEKYVKEYYTLEDDLWFAFICGYGIAQPMYKYDIYKLMLPHFKRFVDERKQDKGLLRHFAIYYIWDYESLESESLFRHFIDFSTNEYINELIYFIYGEIDYFRSIDDIEKKKPFFNKIMSLWEYLLKYNDQKDSESNDINIKLLIFTAFIDVLDDFTTNLIVNSITGLIKSFDSYRFIKELIRLKENGKPNKIAQYIGMIYKVIVEEGIIPQYSDPNDIREIIIFLYENEQKEIADFICNTYAENGIDYLNDIYFKYDNNKG